MYRMSQTQIVVEKSKSSRILGRNSGNRDKVLLNEQYIGMQYYACGIKLIYDQWGIEESLLMLSMSEI